MESSDIKEAASHLPELVAAAVRGEEVVIACNGVPTVKLVPVEARPAGRKGGFWKGKVVEIDPDWWKPDDRLADLFGIPETPGAAGEPPKP